MRKPTEERKKEIELKDELERLISQDVTEMGMLVKQAQTVLPAR